MAIEYTDPAARSDCESNANTVMSSVVRSLNSWREIHFCVFGKLTQSQTVKQKFLFYFCCTVSGSVRT